MDLAELVFALALQRGHPGRSPYSREAMAECGKDPKTPSCAIAPLCPSDLPSCRPPRWSKPRNAWVRIETRGTATHRFAKIARALAASSTRIASDCRGSTCTWPAGARSLALAGLTVVLHESGLREDVMFGHPPLGRGPHGEACLMQVALDQAANTAPWLTAEERAEAGRSSTAREALAQSLLGDSPEALARCFDVGLTLLARARRSCEASGRAWDKAMFSMYGTGKGCGSPGVAESRSKTYRSLAQEQPELSEELRTILTEN